MNFSDKEMKRFKESMKAIEREPLPFEEMDIPDVEDDMPEELEEFADRLADTLIKSTLEDALKSAKMYADKLATFIAIDSKLKDEGYEDKEERYRIIEMLIRM